MQKRCKDCDATGIPTDRPAVYPGPRCATHHKLRQKHKRAKASERHRMQQFGITQQEYDAILESQGGKCAVCQRATGRRKALAVDHEHNKPGCNHPPDRGCPRCIRAIVCGPCNQVVLGRYDVDALRRAIRVLEHAPAQEILLRF